MKNNTIKIIVIAIVIAYCAITLAACTRLYQQQAVVIDVANDKVLCEDTTGNIWCYYGEAKPGDAITLVMNTRGTLSIYDDIIVRAW